MKTHGQVTRRTVLAAAATTVLPMAAARAQAGWPTRPIKLIVPFAPGGSNDIFSRALANKLAPRLGQPIVIENKPGAGGTIGTDAVAKATDGHTLLFASTSITTNAAAGKKLPFDLVKDLEPIGLLGSTPLLVIVANESPFRTLREVLEQARARPNTIAYGSAGIGGINHLAMELLAAEAKAPLVHVPYKGIALAFTDLLGGTLPMLTSSLASATQHMSSGKVRALVVTSARRSPFAPQVPTAAESGLPGFDLESWWGLLAPARTPAVVVKRLNEELNWALGQPDIRELLAREGATPKPGTPEELGKLIAFELGRWSRLIRERNIKTD
ncbi:MAG TPA: tripartite tricarboxylate transporter substrate binding protein [Ramlibacter sp.]|nr:tripartite tricarboxylate transporter substrate binding protein [Ramlibacter sp.]